MDDRLPSLTALVVAFARAAYTSAPATLRAASDPIAKLLLPPGISHLAAVLPIAWRAPRVTQRSLQALGLGFLDHVELRTAAIDAAVTDAAALGIVQFVILGAGLDARAYRLHELARSVVFEVDHPATQQYKLRHITGLAPCAKDVRFVPVDFERDDPGARLAASGHDATVPTFWLWEGVTPYLHPAAIEATVAMIRARSAARSILALTYVPPGALTRAVGRGLERLLLRGARLIREPVYGVMATEAMHALMDRRGLTVQKDTDTRDWALRFWPAEEAHRLAVRERLLVAQVRESYTPTP